MKVEVRGKTKLLSRALRLYAVRRIQEAVERFGRPVRRLKIFIADLNGPRKGTDKRCRVVVGLSGSSPLVVEQTAPDAYQAIDQVAERVKHLIARAVDRRRTRGLRKAKGLAYAQAA
jgi:ribosome-associated translation inhibitor RaiA